MPGGPPVDGRQLLGWIGRQPDSEAMRRRAIRLGRARGYPAYFRSWGPDQVADVFHELQAKARRGEFHWGGSVRGCAEAPAIDDGL